MGEAANVFNSFSFGKWADLKKEEELDKESKRRRNAQIKRLKEQLAEERRLRELGGSGDGDLDLEALIEALQRGEEINEDAYEEDPSYDEYGDRSDADILSEIREYQKYHTGPPGSQNGADSRFWKYNRRFVEEQPVVAPSAKSWQYNRKHVQEARPPSAKPPQQLIRPEEPPISTKFKYNRVVTK